MECYRAAATELSCSLILTRHSSSQFGQLSYHALITLTACFDATAKGIRLFSASNYYQHTQQLLRTFSHTHTEGLIHKESDATSLSFPTDLGAGITLRLLATNWETQWRKGSLLRDSAAWRCQHLRKTLRQCAEVPLGEQSVASENQGAWFFIGGAKTIFGRTVAEPNHNLLPPVTRQTKQTVLTIAPRPCIMKICLNVFLFFPAHATMQCDCCWYQGSPH